MIMGCLVCVFKQPFSVFKQHFMHFNILFHPHVFSQIFLNNKFQFLNIHTKRALSNFLGRTKVLFQFEMIFVLFCPFIDWSIVAQTGVDCTNTVIATWLINDSQLLTPPPVINRSSMRTSQLLWRYVLSDCPFHKYFFCDRAVVFWPFS